MSMNYKEVSTRLPQEEAKKYSQGIILMGNFADSLQKQGLLPKKFAQVEVSDEAIKDISNKVYPEISLTEEYQRQKMILAGKYAIKLGMSEAVYMASLPDFPQKPAGYTGLGLNIPVIIETRFPWMEMAETSGIYIYDYLRGQANNGKFSDWKEDRFEMPEEPFSAWAQDGTKFVNRRPSDVRKELKVDKYRDYRAGRILDAISIANVRPDLVETMFWDIIGTKVGSDGVSCLYRWDDSLKLNTNDADIADPSYRALVLGREIRTLNLAA